MIPGVILAGGRATRMGGGDKGLLALGDSTVLGHVVDRLSDQAAPLAINANGDPARLACFGLPVLPDTVAGHPGPLAGVLAGLDWAAGLGAEAVLTAAADTPFLPRDLAWRLGGGFALARSPSGNQPTFGRWPVTLAGPLRAALAGGLRKIVAFTDAHGARWVEFPDDESFFNVNTPRDLDKARTLA
ncbi:MAG: molybdenum cofactor guanylyltransferase MobA [Paracoccaceae bacterium]